MRNYRRLPLDGLMNARDLGGYVAAGGVTRFGVFVRADVPALLSEHDLRFLRDYGLTTVVDLRSEKERKKAPDLLAAQSWLRYTAIPLYDKAAAHGETLDGRHFSWAGHYIRMAENAKDWMRDVLSVLAAAPGCAMFHCATGKDRTGLIAAALLGLCGVADADIAADYCVSRIYLAPLVAACIQSGRIQTEADPFFATPPENMLQLLAYLHKSYGGMPAYLSACGLPDKTAATLRARLLCPD